MKNIRKIAVILMLVLIAILVSGCQESNEAKYNRAGKLLTEGKYEEAVKLFDEISTYEDASKMAMYGKAIAAAENGDYKSAFSSFQALGDYKDCSMMITYYTARQYESEATDTNWSSQIKAAEAYDTIAFFLDSKDRAENCQKTVYDKAVSYAGMEQYAQSVEMLSALRDYEDSETLRRYYEAFDFEQENKFIEASNSFAALGDYKDSKNQATEVLERGYQKADALEKNGDQETACKIFANLGEYKDSFVRANKPYYDLGIAKREAAEWNAAVAAFEHARLYGDAAEQIKATRYAEGEAKYAAQDWDEAVAAFEKAGNYSDAQEKILATRYAEGEAKRAEKDWDGARQAFLKAGKFMNSAEQIKETTRQEAESYYAAGDYQRAYDLFLQIKDYKNIDSLLKTDMNLIIAAKLASCRTLGNIVAFGRYEQDNNSANGSEEIQWIVLDYDEKEHKALLLSRYGLDAIPYNTEWVDITWEKCTLRSWLNGEFLQSAFSSGERALILTTAVDNSASQGNREWETDGGNNTQDQIFLLSYAEANRYLKVSYYDSNNTRARVAPTEYAIANGAWANNEYQTIDGEAAWWWWLRSPGDIQHSAAYVNYNGSLLYSSVFNTNVVARPAFWLNLDAELF